LYNIGGIEVIQVFRKSWKHMVLAILSPALVCMGCTSGGNLPAPTIEEPPVRYITLMYTNKRHEEVRAYVKEMEYLHGTIDPDSDRMYAFGVVGPMLLTQSVEEMAEQIHACFDIAEHYNIPVYFQLDDCNNYSTYFGAGAPVKYYEHPSMCEWIAFPEEGEEYGGERAYGELPLFWFNWGRWMAAKPFPNFASPELRALVTENLQIGVLKPLMERYEKLLAEDKGYLFAGMAIGWETHIPDYSPHNNLLNMDPDNPPKDARTGLVMRPWEFAQYGYGALTSLGYDQAKLDAEAEQMGITSQERMREILYGVIHDYSRLLAKTCYEAGVPRHKIYTHIVSYSSYSGHESTFTPPIWCAVNEYSIPGFTMSPVTCKYDLPTLKRGIFEADPEMPYFANAEGYAAGVNEEDAAAAYFKELFDAGALNITAFAYGDPPTQYFTFQRTLDFGYNVALRKWLNHED
jgi:hypothetical protein